MRIFQRILAFLILLMLALVAGAAGWVYWRTHVCLPQLDGTVAVSGLSARVEILRDAQGVPHLRATSLEDLIFAQGYVTAQDRLWQMDLSRRLARGELSEIFGERTLRIDIENWTLGLRQVAERAMVESDAQTRSVFATYARGVNAFVSTHLDRLPIEFAMLGYQPRPWQEADSFAVALNMMKTLSTTWPDELMRERVRSKVNAELYLDLFPDRSTLDHAVAEAPAAAASSHAGEGKSRARSASRISQSLRSPRLQELDPVLSALLVSEVGSQAGVGSNNWVVNGAHTQSGRPLLANVPHLSHGVPSGWYMIHLKAPGVNASGVSFPGLPAVILGHNERIAWGATNTGPDVQDLYVENFNFRDPKKYLDRGEWVDAEVRDEIIQVRNARDHKMIVKVTRHGPVVSNEGNRDLALRWTALEPGAMAFAFLRINQAQDWQEFTQALRDFSGSMQNFVYADGDGNIGYYAAGWVPIRKQGDGTLPAQGGTDAFDWTGYIPFENLPQAFNPSGGIIATANGRIVPDTYPYHLTSKWDAPYRTARIFQLLESGNRFSVADMLRVQSDIHSLEDKWLARQLVLAAAKHPPDGRDARFALSVLEKWDGEARSDSAATLVCDVARRALLERVLKPKLGNDLSGYHWPMSTVFLQNVIENRWERWLPPGDADFEATLISSLEEGLRRIPDVIGGGNRNAWRWGETIPLTFRHPLSGGLPFLHRHLDVGPYPQSGTGTTVKATSTGHGPSMRMVVDFSDLDNSVQNITLGQSGQAFSRHYRD
ncbi:MAG: penicillin acylase family protein, partial [Acidobacteria bacterium]|nr:penicillin acylase family protein [Acidobacteriota bacterium]